MRRAQRARNQANEKFGKYLNQLTHQYAGYSRNIADNLFHDVLDAFKRMQKFKGTQKQFEELALSSHILDFKSHYDLLRTLLYCKAMAGDISPPLEFVCGGCGEIGLKKWTVDMRTKSYISDHAGILCPKCFRVVLNSDQMYSLMNKLYTKVALALKSTTVPLGTPKENKKFCEICLTEKPTHLNVQKTALNKTQIAWFVLHNRVLCKMCSTEVVFRLLTNPALAEGIAVMIDELKEAGKITPFVRVEDNSEEETNKEVA